MLSLARLREQFDDLIDSLARFVGRLRESAAAGPAHQARLREVAAVRGRRGADPMRELKDLAARELPTLGPGAYRTFLLEISGQELAPRDRSFDRVFGSGHNHNPLFEESEDVDSGDPVWGSGNSPLFGKNDESDPLFGEALALPAVGSDYSSSWGRFQENVPDRPDHDYDMLFAEVPTEAAAVPAGSREMDCVFGTK